MEPDATHWLFLLPLHKTSTSKKSIFFDKTFISYIKIYANNQLNKNVVPRLIQSQITSHTVTGDNVHPLPACSNRLHSADETDLMAADPEPTNEPEIELLANPTAQLT